MNTNYISACSSASSDGFLWLPLVDFFIFLKFFFKELLEVGTSEK